MHFFHNVRSQSTDTSQTVTGNKRVTVDRHTTHKYEWLFFSSWSILWHSLPKRSEKKCCLLSMQLQEEYSLHGLRFGNCKKKTTWPIEMAWAHFSCMSHGAKQLAWMLKGAVLPCQWPGRSRLGWGDLAASSGFPSRSTGAGQLSRSVYPRWA